MSPREVAPGIFQLGNRTVNWWAITRPEGITLVDAGLPRHVAQLQELLRDLGRGPGDIEAVVLTHADVDHIGIAESFRRRGVPVFIHPADAAASAGDMRPVPKEAILNAWRPRALVATFEYARDGALRPRFVKETSPLVDGGVLDIPGNPRVIHVPGHTPGSCALMLDDASVLFTGDALVTKDPLSGNRKPSLLPRFDNEDHELALRSLEKLAATDAELVLSGHGPPWTAGVASATSFSLA